MQNNRRNSTPEVPEFKEKLVSVNRGAKVVKGGKIFRFSALIVIGDEKGRVGVGMGKAAEIPEAVRKGVEDAKRHLITVPIVGTTIPHAVEGRFSKGHVRMLPAEPGTGVIAGGPVRDVLECVGIKDIRTKSYGSNNPADCERDNKFAEHVPHLDSLIDMSMPDDGFIPYYGSESYQLDFIVLDTVTNTSRAFNIGLQSDEVGIQEYISFEEYLENYYGITEADMDEADEEYLDKLRFEYDEMYNTTSPISKEERKACVDWLKGVFTSGTEAADSRYILFISTVKSDLFVKSEKANYYFDCESPYSCMAFQPFCFALTEAQYNALINGGISSSILSEYYSDFFGVGRHGILRSWSSSVYENYFYYGVDD